jgi:hypothetical protein
MKIELINYSDTYSIISDSYPEEDWSYESALKAIRGCLAETHASLEFTVDGNCVIIPAEIVKQSVITLINETETKE